jgi:hypothetical protein
VPVADAKRVKARAPLAGNTDEVAALALAEPSFGDRVPAIRACGGTLAGRRSG